MLFLDEPSIGVDPVAARELRNTVAGLAATGTTVLLTTHYMAEAEELCDRIAVIAGGEIQALGTADELKHHAEGRRVLEVQAFGVSDEQLAGIDVLPGVREASVEVVGTAQVLTVQSDADRRRAGRRAARARRGAAGPGHRAAADPGGRVHRDRQRGRPHARDGVA